MVPCPKTWEPHCTALFGAIVFVSAVIFCVVRGHASAIKWLDLHCASYKIL